MAEQKDFIEALKLKTFLLNIITELKFGVKLTNHVNNYKAYYKQVRGLSPKCQNKTVLKDLKKLYEEQDLAEEFGVLLIKFKAEQYLD